MIKVLHGNKSEMLSSIGAIMAMALGLYLASLYSFLLFHGLIEIITIAIAFTLFILTWNTRRFLADDSLKLLGIGYAFIAVIDLLHTFAYKGMGVFTGFGANLPTQLWIAARYMQALTLIIAPLLVQRRVDNRAIFGGFAAVSLALVTIIFSGNFPDCYIEGKGLTTFKITSEFVIIALLLASLYLFYRKRKYFNDRIFFFIISSIAFTALSEISFTAYLSVYDFANAVGHFAKLMAFYLTYRAILVIGLREPFDLIFRDLKQAEAALRKAHDSLEGKVRERTTELRASEEKYRAMIECANDAVFINEIKENGMPGPFIEVNELACRQLGYSREELAGLSPMEIDDPLYRDRIAENLKRLLKNGHAVFETAHITKDGRSIPVEVSTRVLELKGTRLLLSLVRDISERKRAEEALRKSEKDLKEAQRLAQIGSWEWDASTDIITWSEEYYHIYGINPAQRPPGYEEHLKAYTPESAARLETAVKRNMQTGESYEIDLELARTDGPRRWVTARSETKRDARGRIIGLRGTAQDVTDKKWAEENLKLAIEDWERTFNAVADLIFIQDADGFIRRANKALCDRLGKTADQVAGMRCYELMHDHHTPPASCPRSKMMSDGVSQACEITESCLGGCYWVNISPIHDATGKIVGSVHVAQDITEAKRLQELETRAQRLDTAGRIAGQVAHDLNNLLGPITAYPELIRELLPSESPAQKYLNVIEDAGNRIADINQQLLTLSRRGHYSQDVVDLNSVISHAINDLGRLPDGISCETDLHPDLMNIIGGAAQLHRVILNLLVNACDAIGNCGKITIQTENIYTDEATIKYDRVPRGEYVKLTVSDTGSGIPPEIMQKIFDPFFTTKSADKKRGSGLGLSVVDAVIKDHGGIIDLHTEVGKGTSFYLYFPITRECPLETASREVPTGNESILVVDDDDVQRDVLNRLLSSLGYRVTACESGERAAEFLWNSPQALMIIDMIMPGGMDGVETYRKALQINPTQRAIIVSGFSETDKVHEAQSMGAGQFVKKPFNRSIIATAVRQELDKAVNAEPALTLDTTP